MATSDFNSSGQLNQLEHDPENHAKRVDNYVWDGSAWVRDSGAAGATVYGINNKEATATYKYFGFQDASGNWYIMRKTIATNIFEYVAGASAYSTAWTNRASQTYTDYATAF